MSITLERFLPERYPVNLDSSRKQRFVNGFNRCRTEASKVEIGLDRNTIVAVLTLLGYEINAINMIIYRLVEAESELIVRKEGK